MQNPYSRYQVAQNQSSNKKKKKPSSARRTPQKKIRKKINSKAPQFNFAHIGLSFFGLLLSFYLFSYTDEVLEFANRVEIGFSKTMASEEAKTSPGSAKKDTKSPKDTEGKVSQLKSGDSQLTMKNASIYKALKDKRRELEKKERRLAQLEEELQLQKTEIEKQLKEMTEMRRNISSKLDKKVVADQESIHKLVGVYSNMKPQNAALILTQLDDELAVQVLGKMKKQSAAAILNYVAPKKAQFLSEKFTGLKN